MQDAAARSSRVDAKTGKKVWQFDTIGGDERSLASWGNDSWKTGGGGGWMTGGYDPTTNTVFWGTANPAPDYDIAMRPGDNLYTSGVIALDPDTGKLKSYFSEVPHDSWDFDGSVGEFVMIDRDGQHYATHPNKGGYVYVYNRDPSQLAAEDRERLASRRDVQLRHGRRSAYRSATGPA